MRSQLFIGAVLAFCTRSLAVSCTRSYTVQAGDYCDKISAANNVSTYQLATLNSGAIDSSCSNLQIGQTVCLGTAGEDCQSVYTVVEGDTCDAISAAHGLSNNTFLFLNNPQINPDCSNIYIDEVLCVATSVQVPAGAPSGTVVPGSGSTSMTSAMTSSMTSAMTSASPTQVLIAAHTSASSDPYGNDSQLPYCDEI